MTMLELVLTTLVYPAMGWGLVLFIGWLCKRNGERWR